MNQAFTYQPRTAIASGIGRSCLLAEDIIRLTGEKKVVLVTDPGIINAGVADQVMTTLKENQIDIHVFSNVKSDPTASSIDEAAELIRSSNTKCVVGLGGGSAMDVAKMASLVAGGIKQANHYALMANSFPEKKVTAIMIPTTSGTGADVTSTVVFSDDKKRKVWAWDIDMAPELSILDAELSVGLPGFLTAATTLDALVHAIEAYAGKRSNPLIEGYSLQSIRLISKNLETAMKEPHNLEARGALALGATLAGLSIEQGGTGLAHCIGHALGTIGNIHHGRAVTIALRKIYSWNIKGAIEAHANIARAMGIEGKGLSQSELALAGEREFSRLVHACSLDVTLMNNGFSSLDVDAFVAAMLSEENKPMLMNNCRFPAETDVRMFAEGLLNPISISM